MFKEYESLNEPEEEPSEEERTRLSGHYANEIDQMLDPTLDTRKRVVPRRERKEIATFPEMLPPYHLNGVVKLVNDEDLVSAPDLDRAYAVLAYVEAKAVDDCKAYQHVFREFLPAEYTNQEEVLSKLFDELDKEFGERFKQALEIDELIAQTGLKIPLTEADSELALDYFESHHSDLKQVLTALRNIRSVLMHAGRIAPFIAKERREGLLQIGKRYFQEFQDEMRRKAREERLKK